MIFQGLMLEMSYDLLNLKMMKISDKFAEGIWNLILLIHSYISLSLDTNYKYIPKNVREGQEHKGLVGGQGGQVTLRCLFP